MAITKLKLSPRTVTGKKVKRLRRQDIVPVHLYGKEIDSLALQSEDLVLRRILPSVGTNIPLSVEVEGKKGENICFVREVQRHPVTEELLHVDFMRVDVSQTIQAEVPVVLVGNAPAVREMGGVLLQPLQRVVVEALPMNVPASFEVDISILDDFERGIFVRDLPVDPNVTIVTDANEMITRVSPPIIEVEAEEGEEAPEEAEVSAEEQATAGEESE